MFFVIGGILLVIIVLTGLEPEKKACSGHKWSYWPDGKMRCDNCKKTPLED